MAAPTLRPYQDEIIAETRSRFLAGIRSVLIQSPTGSGKTLLTAHMLGSAAAKGMPAWFVVHRRELIKQSMRAFDQVGVTHGIVANGWCEDRKPLVQIASVQTLVNRHTKMPAPRLIVWDECHHVAANSWARIFAAFPNAFHIGLTATPERLDGTGLGKWFAQMIKGPDVLWLIENKFLSPYKLFAPPGVSVAGLHSRMGDYIKSELAEAVDKPKITGNAIAHYQRHAAGKRAVVFCVSIEHSKHVVSEFLAAGIPAAHVDGETPTEERDHAIKQFASGAVRVLSNVELFGEGFDLPEIEAAILLRPTQSLGLYLQQVGRSLRPAPGKDCAIILDHAGNVERHGLPDEQRDWSLDGRAKKGKSGDAGAAVRVCPKCFAAQYVGRPVCQECGFVFAPQPRQVEQVEGDLQEVDPEVIRQRRRQEQRGAQSFDDLVELGRQRGYKRPLLWAKHVWSARQARRLAAGRPA
jgi:superfamily II DNA or RNA helicase